MKFTVPMELVPFNRWPSHPMAVDRMRKSQQSAVGLLMPWQAKLVLRHGEWDACTVTLTRVGPRTLDDDSNCISFKYVRDALAVMLVGGRNGQFDNDKRIAWVYQQRKSPEHCIEIELEPVTREQLGEART